jgi:hypothetical protein
MRDEPPKEELTDRERIAALIQELREQGVVWVGGLEILEQIESEIDELFRQIEGQRHNPTK